MWQTVFTEFTAGPKADPADLDRAEAELGFPLPESYRASASNAAQGSPAVPSASRFRVPPRARTS